MDTMKEIENLARQGKGKEAINLAKAKGIGHKETVDAMVRGRTSVSQVSKDREGN